MLFKIKIQNQMKIHSFSSVKKNQINFCQTNLIWNIGFWWFSISSLLSVDNMYGNILSVILYTCNIHTIYIEENQLTNALFYDHLTFSFVLWIFIWKFMIFIKGIWDDEKTKLYEKVIKTICFANQRLLFNVIKRFWFELM